MFSKKYFIHYGKREKPKIHPFLDYILDRVHNHNENILLPIVGQTGSGKSYTALRLAELLDPSFKPSRIVFDSVSFMDVLNNGKLKQGSVIIYDESGVGHDSKNFMTKANKLFNYVMQTFRHLNIIVLFTTPNLGFMDKTTRLLFHGYIRMIDKNEKNKKALAYAYLFKDDPRFGKSRDIKLRVSFDGVVKPIKQLIVNMPSEELIDKYEVKKQKFSIELRRKIERELKSINFDSSKKELTPHQKKIFDMKIGGMSHIEIAEKLGIHPTAVSFALKACEKKGYDWRKVRNNLEKIKKVNNKNMEE